MPRRLFLHSLFVAAPLTLFCCVGEDPAPPSGSNNNNPPGTDGGPTNNPQTTDPAFDITKLDNVTVLQGTSVEVPITFTRASYKDAINVTIADAPSGVSALPLSVPADATEAKLTLVAAPDAKQGAATIKVVATDLGGKLKREKSPNLLVRGPAGSLDQTFGQGGRAIIDADGLANIAGVVVQTDGKVVVGGSLMNDFFLARLTAEGTTDNTFGNTGQTRGDMQFESSLAADEAYGLAISPDQTIVMSGATTTTSTGGQRYTIARFLPNGKLDTQFATVGYVYSLYRPSGTTSPWAGSKYMRAATVMPDGRIIVAGEVEVVPDPTEFGFRMTMTRLKTNGVFEEPQEFYGTFNTPTQKYDARCNAVAVKDSKIVCGGTTAANEMVAWRVNANNGSPDATFFNAAGVSVVASTLAPTAKTSDVHILAQGQVVLSGVSRENTNSHKAAVAAFTSAGAPDTQYNGKGSNVFDWGGVPVSPNFNSQPTVRSVLDAQGRVVVAAAIGTPSYVGIARLGPTGDFDATFGPNGKRTITHEGEGDTKGLSSNAAIALGSGADGRIVIATTIETNVGAMRKIVVYRLWN
jgi:uncharacterized delta-60 repeat protein